MTRDTINDKLLAELAPGMSPELTKAIRDAATRRGCSIEQIVREGLEEYVLEH